MVQPEEIRKEAKRVLTEGKVKYLVGYKRAANGLTAAPVFIEDPGDVDQLIWDATCVQNLSRFLVEEKKKKARQKSPDNRPVAIIAKGCDSRAVNVLIQEKYIERKDVYIIGVSCEALGVADAKKIAAVAGGADIAAAPEEFLAQRCLECKANYPVVFDVFLGEKTAKKVAGYFSSLEPVEALSTDQRWNMWQQQMDKCLRCYACRSVCPMCYCDECVVDSINLAVSVDTGAEEKAQKIRWIEKSPALSENAFYHMVRALHLAGRCIDCGECERVCPVDIPLRHLNKKMEKEAKVQFDYEAGFDPEKPALVSSFRDEDPQDFIK